MLEGTSEWETVGYAVLYPYGFLFIWTSFPPPLGWSFQKVFDNGSIYNPEGLTSQGSGKKLTDTMANPAWDLHTDEEEDVATSLDDSDIHPHPLALL